MLFWFRKIRSDFIVVNVAFCRGVLLISFQRSTETRFAGQFVFPARFLA